MVIISIKFGINHFAFLAILKAFENIQERHLMYKQVENLN